MPDATSAGSEPAPQVSVEDYIPASKTFVTQALIGINVLVFLAMLFFHVSFFEPTSQQVLPWGANLAPLTTSGQWWRLVTACFVHFGIIHIAMNMFILYQVGIFTETLFGNARYPLPVPLRRGSRQHRGPGYPSAHRQRRSLGSHLRRLRRSAGLPRRPPRRRSQRKCPGRLEVRRDLHRPTT